MRNRKRSNLRTDLALGSPHPHASITNSSSARKFVAKDQIVNHPVLNNDVTSNNQYIIQGAADLRALSVAGEQIAATVRDSLAGVRARISAPLSTLPSQAPLPRTTFSENDLNISQQELTRDILSRVSNVGPKTMDLVVRLIPAVIKGSTNSFLPVSNQASARSSRNGSVPDIDYVSMQINRKAGVLDAFTSKIVFSLPRASVANGDIKAIRIFRSEKIDPVTFRNMAKISLYGIERIRADSNRFRTNNSDQLSELEKRFKEGGVDNAISSLIPLDEFRNVRIGTDSDSSGSIPESAAVHSTGDGKNDLNVNPFLVPGPFTNLDRSVSNDLKSLRNLQLQNPDLITPIPTGQVNVGSNTIFSPRMSITQLQQNRNNVSDTILSVNENNSQNFKEIAFLSPSRLTGKNLGNYIEYSHDDLTVLYGRGYQYYVVTVDGNMNESVRSRIVQIVVDGLRIPEFPKRVSVNVINGFVSLNCLVGDGLVEKFEIFRKEIDGMEASSVEASTVSDASGFSSNVARMNRLKNGFIQVGECVNIGGSSGGTFYDRTVTLGRRFVYRVYSVDVFGNKSEAPREVEIFVPDPGSKIVELRKPVLVAEVDGATGKCRLVFGCSDRRVQSLFLARRDLTVGQKSFSPPAQVNSLKMGNPQGVQGRRTLEGIHLVDNSTGVSWNGMFPNSDGDTIFVDFSTQVDHTYQYQIFGVDRFGNRTPFEFSRRVFISGQPVINSPLSLSGTIEQESSGSMTGITLTWIDGNIDISSEDRLGNQNTLAANSVRTLFQVSRRKATDDRWQDFPMAEGQSFFDQVASSGSQAPNFRPDYLEMNQGYLYRVQAFRSGGFISNSSFPISMFLSSPVFTPLNFKVKASDSRVRPFYVMLGWNTDLRSGIVDRWEIQRAEVNNLAAARLNSKNPLDFQKLNFMEFRNVFRESSRFTSQTTDDGRNTSSQFGENHYMDTQLVFGNSYFYRIRAISVDGTSISDWAYRGIRVTSEIFERKQESIISELEKQNMFSQFLPAVSPIDSSIVRRSSSYSLTPGFSSPAATIRDGAI